MDRISEEFKDRLLELSQTGTYVYDLEKGLNIYVNHQYTVLTGYTLADINGMTQEEFFSLFHPDEQEIVAKHMQEVISSELGQVIELEYRFKKADGNWMWCRSMDTAFAKDRDKKTTQFMGSFVDITGRKLASEQLEISNQQLESKNKELEQFIFVASHDLQEPLRTVNSFTDLLEEEYNGKLDANANTYLKYISQASARMSALVRGLLDYGRIGRDMELTLVDCNEIIRSVWDDLAVSILKTNATIEVNKLPHLMAYETELRRMFQNLISNAIKFCKEGFAPHIDISAEMEAGHWKFSVQDNGIGIDSKFMDKIFVIFQRLHPRDEYEGTGIGLAHCLKIAELHGGKIWVESQLDSGSTFYITIPNLETES